jgi:ABC-type dipeptide/oligopeptide/nickel transport system permease subunit
LLGGTLGQGTLSILLRRHGYLTICGLAIFVTILGFPLAADAIQDAVSVVGRDHTLT